MSADVRSIAAVIDWRSDLTNYGELLAEAMAGVDLEIRRSYDWLEEQRERWKRAVRECEDEVTRAKAELAQRKFPTWDGRVPDCTVQEKNLRVAKARLEHAEEKVETCRRWIARLPKLIDELFTGSSRRLRSMLEVDVPNARAELARRIAALESYAGLRPDYAPGPSTLASPSREEPASSSAPLSAEVEPTPPSPLPEQEGGSGGTRGGFPPPSGRGDGGVGSGAAEKAGSPSATSEGSP